MSKHLKAFLSAYLEWIDSGAPHKQPFSRRYGLCSNLYDWSRMLSADDDEDLEEELERMFKAEGLDECHPFGFKNYIVAREANEQHLNQARIDWVRSKVAQYEVA